MVDPCDGGLPTRQTRKASFCGGQNAPLRPTWHGIWAGTGCTSQTLIGVEATAAAHRGRYRGRCNSESVGAHRCRSAALGCPPPTRRCRLQRAPDRSRPLDRGARLARRAIRALLGATLPKLLPADVLHAAGHPAPPTPWPQPHARCAFLSQSRVEPEAPSSASCTWEWALRAVCAPPADAPGLRSRGRRCGQAGSPAGRGLGAFESGRRRCRSVWPPLARPWTPEMGCGRKCGGADAAGTLPPLLLRLRPAARAATRKAAWTLTHAPLMPLSSQETII